MSTTITYEGTMPGSRIQGEVIERHADGSVTVVHPDGSPWRYTVRPEHIVVDEATPTAAVTSQTHPTFRTLREYLMEEQGWEQSDSNRFEQAHEQHFDGFQCTRLTWAEWEDVVLAWVDDLRVNDHGDDWGDDEDDTAQPEPTFVDARFAGGAIQVEQDDEYVGDGSAVVRLALPGHAIALFPHEARALAAALTAQAEAVHA